MTYQGRIDQYQPSTIIIYNQDGAAVLREPSLVAVEVGSNKPKAVGLEVQALGSKDGEGLVIGSPLKNGVVADFDLALPMMLRLYRKTLKSRFILLKPMGLLLTPLELTQIEYRVDLELLEQMGARKATIMEGTSERVSREMWSTYKMIIEISPNQPYQLPA